MIEMGGVKSVKAVLESEGLGSETASVIHKIVEYRNLLLLKILYCKICILIIVIIFHIH